MADQQDEDNLLLLQGGEISTSVTIRSQVLKIAEAIEVGDATLPILVNDLVNYPVADIKISEVSLITGLLIDQIVATNPIDWIGNPLPEILAGWFDVIFEHKPGIVKYIFKIHSPSLMVKIPLLLKYHAGLSKRPWTSELNTSKYDVNDMSLYILFTSPELLKIKFPFTITLNTHVIELYGKPY